MNNSKRLSSRSFKAFLLAGSLLFPGAMALGDTVWVLSGKPPKPFPTKGVTVMEIRKEGGEDMLVYSTDSGSRSKALKTVVQIEVEGEALFTQAETEFAKNELKAASEDYRKALRATSKAWIKKRAEGRLLDLSSQTGDFLGAVSGFVSMAQSDPGAAVAHKPSLDKVAKGDIAKAITAVTSALGSNTKANTKLVVYPFLVSLYNANGQPEKAGPIVNELTTLNKAAGASAAPGDEAMVENKGEIKSAEADTCLQQAKTEFANKAYAKVEPLIKAHGASFVDPDRQAGALFLIAQAKEAEATTPDSYEDAALAYMKVVAHFKGLPAGPAADALFKAGVIEETKLNKAAEAKLIYTQLISEFPTSAAAKDAQTRLAAVKG